MAKNKILGMDPTTAALVGAAVVGGVAVAAPAIARAAPELGLGLGGGGGGGGASGAAGGGGASGAAGDPDGPIDGTAIGPDGRLYWRALGRTNTLPRGNRGTPGWDRQVIASETIGGQRVTTWWVPAQQQIITTTYDGPLLAELRRQQDRAQAAVRSALERAGEVVSDGDLLAGAVVTGGLAAAGKGFEASHSALQDAAESGYMLESIKAFVDGSASFNDILGSAFKRYGG